MTHDHDVVQPRLEELVADGALDPEALGTLGMTLTTGPPADRHTEVTIEALLDGALEDRLAAYAATLDGVEDPILGASASKSISTVIATGILSAWTLADVGVDASPSNLALHFDGVPPRRCRILDPSRIARGRPERDRSIETLMGQTLEPLFDALTHLTGVPAEIQWGNVGNLTAFLYDELDRHGIPGEHASDRKRLLEADTAAWGSRPNPLQDPVRYERFEGDDVPDRYQVRRVCCLKRELPGEEPCVSCPELPRSQRRERLRSRGSRS